MGLEEEVEKKFTKFVDFCKGVLGQDGEQLVVLIKKRYNECSTRFRQSTDMLSLIKSTKTSMKKEPKRNMVHLKDFLNELKAYKKKRKAKDEAGDRVSKLRKLDGNCSEASTDGTVSDTEEHKPNNKTTHELKSEDSNDSVCIVDNNIINNTGDCTTDEIALPVISLKTLGTKESSSVTTSEKSVTNTTGGESELNSINKTDEIASVQSADDDSDVVMIADDDEDDVTVKVNGIRDESCVVIDDEDTSTEVTEGQKSLMSMLNLQRKPDDDVIICDSIKPKPTITNLSFTEIPKLKLKSDKSSKSEGSKSNKVKVEKASSSKSEEVKDNDGEKKKVDKTEKHIKRLEALLEKLKNKIEELREQEMSLEDLDDDMSSYIYEDKLERKFVTVWNKLCQLKGRNKTTGRPAERVFNYSGTRYEEMNKKLERLINKHKEFPDFHDVKNVIKKVNNKSSLGLSASQVDSIAREAFLDVGNMLQERRHNDFMCTFKCRVQDNFSFERDPALYDVELQRKLENNRKQGKDKLEEVINKFADKQIYNDEETEEKGGEEGEEKKDKEGGETSQDDEDDDDDDEDEVVEDIDDVDQFVDATEILALYTPSRPAISVNPKLASFHAQAEGESGQNGDNQADGKQEGLNINNNGMEGGQDDDQNSTVDRDKNGIEEGRKDSGIKTQNDTKDVHNDQKCQEDIVDEFSDAREQDAKDSQDEWTDSSAVKITEVKNMVAGGGPDTDDDIVIVSADSEEDILVKNGDLVEIKPSKFTANSRIKDKEIHSGGTVSSTFSEKISNNFDEKSQQRAENVQTKPKRIAPTPVSSSFLAEISNDDKAELTEGSGPVEKSPCKSDSDVCVINLDTEDDKMDIDEDEKVDSKNDAVTDKAGNSKTSGDILNEFNESIDELDESNNCNDEETLMDIAEDQNSVPAEDTNNSKEDPKDVSCSVINIDDADEAKTHTKEENPKNDDSTDKSKDASPKREKLPEVIGISDSATDTVKSKKASPKKADASEVMEITESSKSKEVSPKKDNASNVMDITEPSKSKEASPTVTPSKTVSPKKDDASGVMEISETTKSKEATPTVTTSKRVSPKKDDASGVMEISETTKSKEATPTVTTSKRVSPKKDDASNVMDITESSKTKEASLSVTTSKTVSPKKDDASEVIEITEPSKSKEASPTVSTSKTVSPNKTVGSNKNDTLNPTKAKEASPKKTSEPTEVATESNEASPKNKPSSDITNVHSPTEAKNQAEEVNVKQNASDVIEISDAVETNASKEDSQPTDLMDITDSIEGTTTGYLQDVVSVKSASVDNPDSNNLLNPDQDVPKRQPANKNGCTDPKSNTGSNNLISGSSSSQENKSIYKCNDITQDSKNVDSSSNSEVKTLESLSSINLQQKSDSTLVDNLAVDSHEVCDISDDSQSMTSDINENDTEISEKRDDLESNLCDVDSQSSSARKPLLVRDFSDDSQSNDCQVIDQPDSECVLIDDDFECDSSIKLEKCSPKTLKLPEFLNTQNPLAIRNRMSNLFNKAKINVGKTSNLNIENMAKTIKSSSGQNSCSQVSTSSENFLRSPRKMSKHLPTTSLKKTEVHVDSFLIEIDEADLDCVSNSMEVDEDLCQSTTEEFENNEVSSSICDPDVIILSDSD